MFAGLNKILGYCSSLKRLWFYFIAVMCFAQAEATIYGADSLTEVQESPAFDLSRAVAVQMGSWSLDGPHRTLESSMLCHDERFSQQSTRSNCTGFMIAQDKLLTASHCVNGGFESTCKSQFWVFNYALQSSLDRAVDLQQQDVYRCVKAESSPNKPLYDFAIVTLDRPVSHTKPLQLDLESDVKKGEELFSIHSPRGLPLKQSEGVVRFTDDSNYLNTNLDTMRGSSGAPVFSKVTNKVVGVLTSGDLDFELDEEPFCNLYKLCADDDCRGESVLTVKSIKDFL